jgi:hypothetical protein
VGKEFETIDEKMQRWVKRQHMFFVATAPLAGEGMVNLSPKGHDSLRILGPNKVAYLDLPGSGIETLAHVKENGRIAIMLCAFDGPPRIVRFHGRGQVVETEHAEFEDLYALFPDFPVVRSIIVVDVARISDSCGYGVPVMDFKDDRRAYYNYVEKHGAESIQVGMREENKTSLDGLPGLGSG